MTYMLKTYICIIFFHLMILNIKENIIIQFILNKLKKLATSLSIQYFERDKRSILKRPFYFADKGFQRSSHLIELQAKGRPIFDLHKDEPIRRRLEAIVDKVLELV